MNVHNSIHAIVFPGSFCHNASLCKVVRLSSFLDDQSKRTALMMDNPISFLSIPLFFRRMNHTPTHPNSFLITRFYLWALIFHFLWALSYLVISYKKRGMRFDSYCNQNFLTTATTRFWLIFYKRLTILRYSQNSDWFRKFRPEWHH